MHNQTFYWEYIKNVLRTVCVQSIVYEKNLKNKVWCQSWCKEKTLYLTHQQQNLHIFPDNIQNIHCAYCVMHVHIADSHHWMLSYGNVVITQIELIACYVACTVVNTALLQHVHSLTPWYTQFYFNMTDTLNICLYKYFQTALDVSHKMFFLPLWRTLFFQFFT